jgi:hypothetical protein
MQSSTLDLALDELPPDDSWTLMLSIGIEYGAFRRNGKIEEVRRFGAAKIMALLGKDGASGDSDDDDRYENSEEHDVEPAILTVQEDASAGESHHEPAAVDRPEVRYVYTVKAPAVEKQEHRVYGYAIPAGVRGDVRNVTTTQNAASLYEAPVDLPVVPYVHCDAEKSTASRRIFGHVVAKEYRVLPDTSPANRRNCYYCMIKPRHAWHTLSFSEKRSSYLALTSSYVSSP